MAIPQAGAAGRITAVTCVKNEGPFLLEWIAFHRLLGVTDFLFYSNDCTDGTDALLDALAATPRDQTGRVIHLPNPAEGRNYQMEALKDAAKQPVVREADWIWIADVDEFLNIHTGDHSIPELIAACGAPQAISIPFQFFANCAVRDFTDRPVIAQFTRTHNPDIWCAETAIEVKTLVRRDFPLQYLGAHRPFVRKRLRDKDLPRWTDASGRAVPRRFLTAATPRRIRRFPASGSRDFATLNHYALRSLDSYIVKTDRGDVNREGRVFDDAYWRERNDPACEDTRIHRYLPRLTRALEALKAEPEIGRLHGAAVQAHRARRDALMAQEDFAALYEHLASLPALPPGEAELIEALGL